MFIRSIRLKNLMLVAGAALLGLALGIGVLFLGAKAAQSGGEPAPPESALPPESSGSQQTMGTDVPEDGEKVVYLTFDDGPSVVTGEILDVLKEKGVPATFFVIGATTERGKGLYQRILDEGHALGIHSYSHRYQEIYESADAYLKDFDRLADHLESIVGVKPNIFRFPGGSKNNFAMPEVLDEIKKEMEKRGCVWFDWNALAKDDKAKATPAQEMFDNVVSSAGDQEKILILLHDDALRTTAAECVSMLIDHYQGLGYRFEALTAETEPIHLK
ncbi:MAG TPA: polysaccharide deacetylase [Candidatus Merdivicinus excrementipullorum]|uniref:Polysaccharide deacetylase n=1 Tax=Candidatus Merdivicinus excrementipullorum TaxID=2840867 RepID=A0A9D1K092_9FIRM|nr:polysaccharide deacetylase [Candidatus Merdivicinus excrementipullorum]